MNEKDIAIGQFETIAEQKAVIDRAQESLLKELNDVKKQIDVGTGCPQLLNLLNAEICSNYTFNIRFIYRKGANLGARRGCWRCRLSGRS